MTITKLKQFFKEVRETRAATKDTYIYLAIVLSVFVLLLALIFDYFMSGLIIVLLYAAVSPFLMAVASYFVAPLKQPLEQKQKYFFRLVKQFYRLDSMRIMIPLRTFFFAALFSMATYYVAVIGTVFFLDRFDPTTAGLIEQFAVLVQNGASLEQIMNFFALHEATLQPYLFASELVMVLSFVLSFSYMLIKRFFFVFLHINLYNKSKLKIDVLKAKYYKGSFKRTQVNKFYFPSVAPIFVLASIMYLATAISFYVLLGNLFNIILIFTAAAAIYIITLAFFLPYLLTVNLVLFGQFMEQNAITIFQVSINDITMAITNPNISNEEKEKLIEIRKVLELQKTIYLESLKATTKKVEEDSIDEAPK